MLCLRLAGFQVFFRAGRVSAPLSKAWLPFRFWALGLVGFRVELGFRV